MNVLKLLEGVERLPEAERRKAMPRIDGGLKRAPEGSKEVQRTLVGMADGTNAPCVKPIRRASRERPEARRARGSSGS